MEDWNEFRAFYYRKLKAQEKVGRCDRKDGYEMARGETDLRLCLVPQLSVPKQSKVEW